MDINKYKRDYKFKSQVGEQDGPRTKLLIGIGIVMVVIFYFFFK